LNGTKEHKTASPTQKCGSRMLLVLGPHRSGTSLTARMLECFGAVNSNILLPPQPDNPKGYYEDRDVYLFNQDVLLPALGADWSSVGPIDWAAAGSSLEPLRERALEILRKNYEPRSGLHVLKEPRLARLLPFWRGVLDEAGFESKLVLPIRDPLAMARSLAKRNGLPINHGAVLYLRHWLDILRDGSDLPAAFVVFERIFENPREGVLESLHCQSG
jgi:hypothetical protein